MAATRFFASRGLRMRPLVPRDITAAELLVAEAGWNQKNSDWSHLITNGIGRCVVNDQGKLGATAVILPHGERIAWICMVLVTAEWRKQGIATELLRRAITEAARLRLTPGLDATEAGQPVYQRLGFRDVYALSRYEATLPKAGTTSQSIRQMTDADLSDVIRLDATAFGAPRPALLTHLLDRMPDFAWVIEVRRNITGFCLGRDGREADLIGPIVCGDTATALALFDHALAARKTPNRRLFLDVLDARKDFIAELSERGFTRQRGFMRMIKGSPGVLGNPATLHAIAGPELG